MMERIGRIREYVRSGEETAHFDLHFKMGGRDAQAENHL